MLHCFWVSHKNNCIRNLTPKETHFGGHWECVVKIWNLPIYCRYVSMRVEPAP